MPDAAPETGADSPRSGTPAASGASASDDAGHSLINRELSLLAFNRRVLEQAKDGSTPLLERLRFLTICSTNLDEFFEIRVSGLRQQIAAGVEKRGPDGLTAQQALRAIYADAPEQAISIKEVHTLQTPETDDCHGRVVCPEFPGTHVDFGLDYKVGGLHDLLQKGIELLDQALSDKD